MRAHDHLGLTFDDRMNGWLGVGQTDPADGRVLGQKEGTALHLRAHVTIENLRRFIEQPDHVATLDGTVSCGPLGVDLPLRNGTYNVLVVDPKTGARQMVYEARFTAASGERFFLRGVKHVADDPGVDVIEDMTRLEVLVHHGDDDQGPVYGAGQMFFDLADVPKLLATMKVTGKAWFGQAMAARLAFLSFAYGVLRDTYVADVNPLYDASYQNVVLQGSARDAAGAACPFFLVSGIHTKNFPWGDDESFCDVLLIVGDPAGQPGRFAIASRRLEVHQVDVQGGLLVYDGPIFDLSSRGAVSFSEMHGQAPPAPAGRATLSLRFRAERHPLAPFPFRVNSEILDRLSYGVRETLRRTLPSEHQFGFQIVPSTLSEVSGTIALQLGAGALLWTVDTAVGEAEDTTIRNIREPTLLYNYVCAIRPAAGAARVQFHTSSLRDDREHWGKDRLDALFGVVVSRFASRELDIQPGGVVVRDLAEPPPAGGAPRRLFEKVGDPLLQVDLDHFPTGVFQRKIITVVDPSGERCLALEESMETLRREAKDSQREVVVAAIRGDDKHAALARALSAGGFWEAIEARRAEVGKSRADLDVVIKPNFMFAYNRADRTTFTDPDLVLDLATKLRAAGYERVTVVEAQSTYGEYFDRRGVKDVAEYTGYSTDGSVYRLVDLTEDEQEQRHFGVALGFHPVAKTWRDADFRISFAKNKTHSYAYYTLTLKNIYGALSLPNKFKEYHCDRGIADTTIEFLTAFPVHFGIIDAWSSADGPFGIFADSEPNDTRTIIAGADLVAVDWVGASKMGIDPGLSMYMKPALRVFGKPKIVLVGDGSVYHPWLNVPVGLSLAANFGLDANHYFGNLLYMSGAYMDEQHFTMKSRGAMLHAARAAVRPLQEAVFLQTGGARPRANRALSRFFTWLGTDPGRPAV